MVIDMYLQELADIFTKTNILLLISCLDLKNISYHVNYFLTSTLIS